MAEESDGCRRPARSRPRPAELVLVLGMAGAVLLGVSLLPAPWLLSAEGLHFFAPQRHPAPGPARCQGEERLRWLDAPAPPGAPKTQPTGAWVAVGHASNESFLGVGELAAARAGTARRWEEISEHGVGPIVLYEAGSQHDRPARGPVAAGSLRSHWQAVMEQVSREPGALAIVPLEAVVPSVRVLSDPVDAAGAPVPVPPLHTLTFTGDLMLASWVRDLRRLRALAGNRAGLLDPVTPWLRRADLTVANLEYVVFDGPPLGGRFGLSFGAEAETLDLVRDAGIDLVSLANNHAGDYGPAALRDTLLELERRGIAAMGAGSSPGQAYAPARLQVGEARVALLGLTAIDLEEPLPVSGGLWVGRIPETQPVRAHGPSSAHAVPGSGGATQLEPWERAVLDAREGSDLVIVFMHWGQEFEHVQSPRQRSIGRRLVDLGADLVVGSHPHSVQGIEWVRGAPIVYSLGNLIFGLNEAPGPRSVACDGVLLQVRLLGARLFQLEVVPVLEVLASPRAVPAGCSDPLLADYRRRTLARIEASSRF